MKINDQDCAAFNFQFLLGMSFSQFLKWHVLTELINLALFVSVSEIKQTPETAEDHRFMSKQMYGRHGCIRVLNQEELLWGAYV